MSSISINNRIKQLRLEAGVTQTELSKLLDLDHRSISILENENRMPSIQNIFKSCKLFSVRPDDLLYCSHVSCVQEGIGQMFHVECEWLAWLREEQQECYEAFKEKIEHERDQSK